MASQHFNWLTKFHIGWPLCPSNVVFTLPGSTMQGRQYNITTQACIEGNKVQYVINGNCTLPPVTEKLENIQYFSFLCPE